MTDFGPHQPTPRVRTYRSTTPIYVHPLRCAICNVLLLANRSPIEPLPFRHHPEGITPATRTAGVLPDERHWWLEGRWPSRRLGRSPRCAQIDHIGRPCRFSATTVLHVGLEIGGAFCDPHAQQRAARMIAQEGTPR